MLILSSSAAARRKTKLSLNLLSSCIKITVNSFHSSSHPTTWCWLAINDVLLSPQHQLHRLCSRLFVFVLLCVYVMSTVLDARLPHNWFFHPSTCLTLLQPSRLTIITQQHVDRSAAVAQMVPTIISCFVSHCRWSVGTRWRDMHSAMDVSMRWPGILRTNRFGPLPWPCRWRCCT